MTKNPSCLRPSFTKAQKRHSERGVAMIEFALVLPLLLLLLVGTVEITRYVLATQKVDKVANQLADFVTKSVEPQNIDAATLSNSFQQLMSPYGADDAGFVMSVIGIDPDNPEATDHTIFSQTSYNDIASNIGEEGTPINADNLDKIELRNRDVVVAVEVKYVHQTLLGDTLENIGVIASRGQGSESTIDGEEIYRKVVYRHRLDGNVAERDPQLGALGDPPKICGYYRNDDVDYDDDPENVGYMPPEDDDVISTREPFDIWPIGADDPHPCACYKQGGEIYSDTLGQKLKTCRPELLNAPYNCPSRDQYEFDLPVREELELPEDAVTCCTTTTAVARKCFGCIDDNDKLLAPTAEVTDPECQAFVPPPEPPSPPEPPAPPSPPEPAPAPEPPAPPPAPEPPAPPPAPEPPAPPPAPEPPAPPPPRLGR